MILNEYKYIKPKTVEDLTEAMSQKFDTKIIAGGQSLIPLMKMGLTSFDQLVDISDIRAFKVVRIVNDSIEIGSMVRHCDLGKYDEIVTNVPLLANVANQIGDPQIRHRGTIGGAISHGDPASDLAGCFVALRGTAVVISKNGIREISSSEFYHGFLETALGEDEILASIRFPLTAGDTEFFKISKRAQDWAISGMAVARFVDTLSMGLISMAATTVSVGIDIQELHSDFESVYQAVASKCSPTEDIYGTKNYRLHLLKVFMKQYAEKYSF